MDRTKLDFETYSKIVRDGWRIGDKLSLGEGTITMAQIYYLHEQLHRAIGWLESLHQGSINGQPSESKMSEFALCLEMATRGIVRALMGDEWEIVEKEKS